MNKINKHIKYIKVNDAFPWHLPENLQFHIKCFI